MKPTIGRIVHYQAYGTPGGEYKSVPRAAIVTQVIDDLPDAENECPRVGLAIMNPTGMFFNTHVSYSKEPKPGHWNWPPREPSQKGIADLDMRDHIAQYMKGDTSG